MESKALVKSTNNIIAGRFFARTLSRIRRIVKIFDIVDKKKREKIINDTKIIHNSINIYVHRQNNQHIFYKCHKIKNRRRNIVTQAYKKAAEITIKRAVTMELRDFPEESFHQCIGAWQKRMERYVRFEEDYFDEKTI